jgi:hypothetical protein
MPGIPKPLLLRVEREPLPGGFGDHEYRLTGAYLLADFGDHHSNDAIGWPLRTVFSGRRSTAARPGATYSPTPARADITEARANCAAAQAGPTHEERTIADTQVNRRPRLRHDQLDLDRDAAIAQGWNPHDVPIADLHVFHEILAKVEVDPSITEIDQRQLPLDFPRIPNRLDRPVWSAGGHKSPS